MKEDEILKRFEEIERQSVQLGSPSKDHYYEDQEATTRWLTNARALLGDLFYPGHTVLLDWDRTKEDALKKGIHYLRFYSTLDTFKGIFHAAHDQLKSGHLTTLVESIRAETEHELLDQADELADGDYVVAATVIAGGALETRLRHLCERDSITWNGPGSIAKYDSAIGTRRKAGTVTIYSKTDSKQVTAWGGMRNDAAHRPAMFNNSASEVRTMISGIRQFLDRVK